jgi:DNA-binding PadR family transcriptional regulator
MRANQTQTAILGALSVEPMTGYALREAIRDVLGHFWSESFGQIYPTLAELERGGYVRRRGSSKPGSSVFAITPAGRTRLRRLLREPARSTPARNGVLLRLYFGRQLGPARCRDLVVRTKEEAEDRLARFAAIRREIEQDRKHAADAPYWLMTVSAGEHAARAAREWAEETIAALDRLATGSGGSENEEGGSVR